MAQEIQSQYSSCTEKESSRNSKSAKEAAFSPGIVEIGFIDEETEEADVTSDLSEVSLSEDEKLNVVDSSASQNAQQSNNYNNDDRKSCLSAPNSSISIVQNGKTSDSTLHQEILILPSANVPSLEVSFTNHSNDESNFITFDAKSHDEESTREQQVVLIDPVVQTAVDEDPNLKDDPQVLSTLEESIAALQQSLDDKTASLTFEKLSKKNPDATVDVAKLPENGQKNRYKDVLPYDESRVPLMGSESGDYINASFVKMSIPPLNLQHEYIAAQGPLPHTCDDFWQMVWEQNCCIIVMVTTLKERNRVKCHKYWPDLCEMVTYSGIQITCFHETTTQAVITRDLLLANAVKNEERHIIQIQYVAWPDHGVPDDATEFLDFVQQLREWRKLIGGMVIVHCSAGVGRTGVFILMETAMCLIESDNPVYPLELVQAMRDQRMMMVQTVGQYKFICEAILKLYNDHENSTSGTSASR